MREDRTIKISDGSLYSVGAIDSSFINCIINPEFYKARRPSMGFETSLISSTLNIPVYVNANGAGAVYVLPMNMMSYLTGAFLDDSGTTHVNSPL